MQPGRMRAIWMKELGGPEVLVAGDASDPVAGPGHVVVDVAFANITFVETQFRATGFGPFRPDLPMIPGNGVGGVVAAVGDGVDPGLVGQRVVATTGGSGGYAERAAADADDLIAVPGTVGLDDATALLADGRTALRLIDIAAVQPGDRVLILAAAGGVGTLAVQRAAATGATVIGAAGGVRKVDVVHDLGAAVALDYTRADWVGSVGPVDVLLDGVGGDLARAAVGALRPGGRLVTYGAASGDRTVILDEPTATDRGVTVARLDRLDPVSMRAYTARALAEAAADRLRPVIGQRFPLDRAADAHAAIESRATIGKTLLDVRR
jgi:NADPH:quinone reductase